MQSYSAGSNSEYMAMGGDGIYGSGRLEEIAKGATQFVKFPRKGILESTMKALGATEPPVFSVVECGDDTVKVSIKLALSNLPTDQGERITYSVIESGPFLNHAYAEESAVLKAFKHLESRHHIRIADFSSRVIEKINSYNTHGLVVEAIGCINSVLDQWNLLLGKFKEFTKNLGQEEFGANVTGQPSAMGRVYGVLRDYLIGIEGSLDEKTEDVRSDLVFLEDERTEHEETIAERAQLLQNNGNFQEVLLSSKDLLEHVLSFYGLDDPQYINIPKPQSVVKTLVNFEFPYMPDFKYGGKLAIAGKAYTSLESEEEVAYKALLFIEDNFKTKVVDYNYSRRKKAVKEQNELMLMLSNTLELSDNVKMMFGELINAIQGKRRQFNLDPSSIFAGTMAEGQIEAYRFCASGLAEVEKYSEDCIAACEPHFEVLQKLTWKLTVAKTNLHL